MKKALKEYLHIIESDLGRSAADFLKANDYLHKSSAQFTRGNLEILCVPKMFTEEAFKVIKNAGETMHGILEKVISHYLADSDYRKLFPFSKELEDLIMIPCGYERKLPIARLDLFFNEESFDYKFCEFNADGASAMNEDREIVNSWKDSKTWSLFQKSYSIKTHELFDSWVNEFLDIYSGYKGRVDNPNVAIVDFLELGTKSEFEVFKEAFIKRGIHTVIADIRSLRYKDGKLFDMSGNKIDAIYRRAVTSECMERLNQITDFITAVKEQAVCVIGAFRTQIIHDKNIFWILKMPETQAILSKEENDFIERHIPKTTELKEGNFDLEEVLKNKDSFLIKPADRYGSFGVADGGSLSNEEWCELVTSKMQQGYILQEYCNPYKSRNGYFGDEGNPHFDNYNNMTGIFAYNGKAAGLYTRSMSDRITTEEKEGRVVCSIIVKEKAVY